MPYGTVNADVIQTSTSGGILGAGNASIMKNRIINGAMVIDQRNAGAAVSVTGSDQFATDRWAGYNSSDGIFSLQQVTDAPASFVNSLKATITTADASIGATQYSVVRQSIEGYNIADLGWGTANAKTITLSFWVKSSLTGTFGGVLINSAANRSYPYTYTISAANTWEYETITIAGDTSGTWLTTNGIGIRVDWSLAAGSTYSGTAGAWAAALYLGATGQTQVLSTLNATIQWTGVQLELGSSATGFEYRQYGTELNLCQRYFEKSYDINTAVGASTGVGNWDFIAGTSSGGNVLQTIRFTVSKRATGATITGYNDDGTINQWKVGNSSGTVTTATPTFDLVGTGNFRAYVNSGQGNVIGRQIGNWTASSEL